MNSTIYCVLKFIGSKHGGENPHLGGSGVDIHNGILGWSGRALTQVNRPILIFPVNSATHIFGHASTCRIRYMCIRFFIASYPLVVHPVPDGIGMFVCIPSTLCYIFRVWSSARFHLSGGWEVWARWWSVKYFMPQCNWIVRQHWKSVSFISLFCQHHRQYLITF